MKTNDRWIKCISQGGNVHATAITAVNLIEDARAHHRSSPVEIKALGEALIAGLLLASTCKIGERISLSIKGDRFLRQAIVDADPSGTVRGFVVTSDVAGVLSKDRGPWQNGLVSVVRLKDSQKEPYVGTVPSVTGHLAKDITFYFSQSEQIPSAVGLAVNLNQKGEVEAAGGFLVQVMPGASEQEISSVEDNIQHMESLASQISQNPNPTQLLGRIFSDLTFTILEERPLKFECTCSKDRVTRALKLLGVEELKDMISKDNGAEVRCDFCGKEFRYTVADLADIIRKLNI